MASKATSVSEVISELKKDPFMIRVIRIIGVGLSILVFFNIISFGINIYRNQPVKVFWGLYETSRIDTVRVINTVYKNKVEMLDTIHNLSTKQNKPQINVTSTNQKGGQTAGSITNN